MWTTIFAISLVLVTVGIIGMAAGAEETDEGAMLMGVVVLIISLILVIAVSGMSADNIEDILPLLGHIDHDKTTIKEENGEPTDLYLTVDGKEYHIILQESKEE